MKNRVIRNKDEEYWFEDDNLHRDDGPAVTYENGQKMWYKNGELHREDGPAIIRANGKKEWYLYKRPLTREEWWNSITHEMKVKALFNGEGL
jgi:hypothetical protein